MPKKKPEPPSPARRMAWHVASDITWVALYRGIVVFLITMVVGMVSWQSNRIISRQDELSKLVGDLRTDISVEQNNVMNLTAAVAKSDASIHDEEKRLNRTNDRQIEMAKQIAVIESQLMDLRAVRR